jgi:hypothetical protein
VCCQNQQFLTASSPHLSQSTILPPWSRIFGNPSTCAETRTSSRTWCLKGINACEPAATAASDPAIPVKAVREFLVPKRRHSRAGPVEAPHNEDVNLLDGIVGTCELEEDCLIARCTSKSVPTGSRGCLRHEKMWLLRRISNVFYCLCCMRQEPQVLH